MNFQTALDPCLDATMDIDPQHGESHVGRGHVHGQRSHSEEALASIDAALRIIDPQDACSDHQLGTTHGEQNHPDTELVNADAAMEFYRRDPESEED